MLMREGGHRPLEQHIHLKKRGGLRTKRIFLRGWCVDLGRWGGGHLAGECQRDLNEGREEDAWKEERPDSRLSAALTESKKTVGHPQKDRVSDGSSS